MDLTKILKNCPSGMELDCVMYESVYYDYVDELNIIHCYIQHETYKTSLTFNQHGTFNSDVKSKCVIFPKGKTTWEGFAPPCQFKDGDVVFYNDTIAIFKEWGDETLFRAYVIKYLYKDSAIIRDIPLFGKSVRKEIRFATEEEKQKLFAAIKDNGYKWNPETKTLEKLIIPKFHEGDWVVQGCNILKIRCVGNEYYCIETVGGYVDDMLVSEIDSLYHRWTIKDAKDGDVLFHLDSASNGIFIFKEILQRGTIQKVICYCDYDSEDGFCLGENHTCCWTDSKILHPATKEQCNLLFQKIKEAGYKWEAETKTLEKLIEPKFKVGDKVKDKNNFTYTVLSIEGWGYIFDDIHRTGVAFGDQDKYELVPNKFDISTLKPFDKVLVRTDNSYWRIQFFERINKKNKNYPFVCMNGYNYKRCIPYEGNEHLLGTANDCDEYYKNSF